MATPMASFEGSVAFITGAASGIGRELAEQLVLAGARVVLADRDEAGLARSASALGGRASSRVLDVVDRVAFRAAIREAHAAEGRLDYVFNNAGIGVGGEARDLRDEDWDRVFDVNVGGVINGTLAAYPLMVKQGSGHIVNVASVAGLLPLPGEISYTASKWAVVGLSRVLRIEGADLGVKVSVVCPGKIETPIYDTSPIVGLDREKVLALWPRGLTPRACARVILEGVAKNRAQIIVSRHAKGLAALERLSPRLVDELGRRYMKVVRRHRLDGGEDG
jgi:NADP-dependent 3-hydroxy acid dehydrogenase YdfG